MTNFFTAFLLHLHPRLVPRETIRFTLSFGLGGIATTLFIVLVGSGLLQLLQYSPNPGGAYLSIERMYAPGVMGGFIRNIHYWAGNLLVIVTALHLFRVLFTGALAGKRRLNWIIGIFIFLLVLFANFTGYLLPWDQLAYWAVTIFTNMMEYIPVVGAWFSLTLRGGRDVGPVTLNNFFALHIGVLPSLLAILLVCHFWLIRKAGGLVVAEERSLDKVPVNPNLLVKEITTGLILLAFLSVFSALIDAPLSGPANPGESPNPTKAAWYFMGLQELLLHLHPSFAFFIVPLVMLGGLLILPILKDASLPHATWFGGQKGARLVALVFLIGIFLTLAAVCADEILLRSQSLVGARHLFIFRGIVPVLTVFLGMVGLYIGLKKLAGYTRAECLMAVVVAHLAIISGLTIIGIWFRGPGMKLVWFT